MCLIHLYKTANSNWKAYANYGRSDKIKDGKTADGARGIRIRLNYFFPVISSSRYVRVVQPVHRKHIYRAMPSRNAIQLGQLGVIVVAKKKACMYI